MDQNQALIDLLNLSVGEHGIKGAAHGIKGGRPRRDLTEEQRAERRLAQKEAYRRRKGIPPAKLRLSKWNAKYLSIWAKLPGEPLTSEEFAKREPFWNHWIALQAEEV